MRVGRELGRTRSNQQQQGKRNAIPHVALSLSVSKVGEGRRRNSVLAGGTSLKKEEIPDLTYRKPPKKRGRLRKTRFPFRDSSRQEGKRVN